MRFRIIDIVKWTAVIAAILAIGRVAPGLLIFVGIPLVLFCCFLAWVTTAKNDWWAIYGMLTGVGCGIIAGVATDLGLLTISLFNPNLPARDFRVSFGIISGVILRAFMGALIGGVAGNIVRRRGRGSLGA